MAPPTGITSSMAPLHFAVCCPAGALAQNGVCYCTRQVALQAPYACRVICMAYDLKKPPAEGGCLCEPGFAGPLCDRRPCLYNKGKGSRRLFCATNVTVDVDQDDDYYEHEPDVDVDVQQQRHVRRRQRQRVEDCSELIGRKSIANLSELYPPCRCFNGGRLKSDYDDDDGEVDVDVDGHRIGVKGQTHSGCDCDDGFSGDLCQIRIGEQNVADQVTANTFLAIIAIAILGFTLAFCCARRHQRWRRATALRQSDWHQHRHVDGSETPGLQELVPAFVHWFPKRSSLKTANSGGENEKNRKDKSTTANGVGPASAPPPATPLLQINDQFGRIDIDTPGDNRTKPI